MIIVKRPSLFLFLGTGLLISFQSLGQFENYNTENERWFPGTVQTMDNKILTGELNYNFVSQALRLRQSGQIETLNAEKVMYFELEPGESTQKVFYSLPYKDESRDRERAVFFEVVHEGKGLALLSRHVFEMKEKRRPINNDPLSNNPPSFYLDRSESVTQVIYLANASGVIKPYLVGRAKKWTDFLLRNPHPNAMAMDPGLQPGYENEEYNLKYNEKKLKESNADKEVKRFKFIDKNALSESIGADFHRLEYFIESNKIQLNTIEGLILVVNQYSKINNR
ncbi:MAG: hypothetical protein MJA30_05835 [Cytophagales bacterium]|nr:hypothetical protein [Cytophagales bacterium]